MSEQAQPQFSVAPSNDPALGPSKLAEIPPAIPIAPYMLLQRTSAPPGPLGSTLESQLQAVTSYKEVERSGLLFTMHNATQALAFSKSA